MTKCGKELDKWNKDVFGNLQVKRKCPKDELKVVQMNMNTSQACSKEKDIRLDLERLDEQEHIFWSRNARSIGSLVGTETLDFFTLLQQGKG